jgi:hypothetical protein
MRRTVFFVLVSLEAAAASVLFLVAAALPSTADVQQASARLLRVSTAAGRQVSGLRAQAAVIRKRQPQMLYAARQLERQVQAVSADVRHRDFRGVGVSAVGDALDNIADGLDGMASTLGPEGLGQFGKGLGATADYLDGQVAPTALRAADALDDAARALRTDAGRLEAVLKGSPLELKAARAMVDSLTRFEEGLGRMQKLTGMKNFRAMREGFKGLETSLDSGAEQVEKASGYTIPKVTVKGLRLQVDEQPFWPEGKNIAAGMRKGAVGCAAAGKEMDAVEKELPKLRASLGQSRQVVAATRQALASALANEEKLAPVLESLPRTLGRLARELPALAVELARMLRQTARLADVATALRLAEKNLSAASARWPKLRGNLTKSAALLRTTRKELKHALAHRREFEQTVRESVEAATSVAETAPAFLEELGEGLEQQEASLGELAESIEQVNEAVPAAARSAARLLALVRVLLVLVGGTVAVHACWVLTKNKG